MSAARWGPLGIVAFWVAVMGLVYVLMKPAFEPRAPRISASGELVIERGRDGHFRATGSVNGRPVRFLVDTGASLVTVSEAFAREAGLPAGEPTVFKTANGELAGRVVRGVPVALGGFQVPATRVGVGLQGLERDEALLGQSFLSRFEVLLSGPTMTLRPRP